MDDHGRDHITNFAKKGERFPEIVIEIHMQHCFLFDR